MANHVLTTKAIEDLSIIWNYTWEVWSEKQADKYQSFTQNYKNTPPKHGFEKETG